MSHTEGPSQRQLRVGEQLREILGDVLRRGKFHDPVLLDAGYSITISEVRPTPDLKQAKVYVMSLGGVDMDVILPALNQASSFISKEVGKKLTMKFTPKFRFVEDDSFIEAAHIEGLLRNLPKSSEE